MPHAFQVSSLTARPQRELSSHRSLIQGFKCTTATTTIYILGENHKLNTFSALSCLGDPQHYMQYSKDLHKALIFLMVLKTFIVIENKFAFIRLNISKNYD